MKYIAEKDDNDNYKKMNRFLKENNIKFTKDRIKDKIYPLVEWKMTEKDCLEYCRQHGIKWIEHTKNGDIDLYDILDRVSCWCCSNKNLKELRNIYLYLPEYWEKLKELQLKTERPFKKNRTIFELEEKFKNELFK